MCIGYGEYVLERNEEFYSTERYLNFIKEENINPKKRFFEVIKQKANDPYNPRIFFEISCLIDVIISNLRTDCRKYDVSKIKEIKNKVIEKLKNGNIDIDYRLLLLNSKTVLEDELKRKNKPLFMAAYSRTRHKTYVNNKYGNKSYYIKNREEY